MNPDLEVTSLFQITDPSFVELNLNLITSEGDETKYTMHHWQNY